MTYQNAIDYINQAAKKGSRPGLERISELLARMGNPQNRLKTVHVAGTNGKGSFSAILSSVLSSAGYKTGLFSSPYMLSVNESIKINGYNIPDASFAEVCGFVKACADSMEDTPTEFEILTAVAYEYFYRKKCDIAVIECGMGGRLDATNLITPVLSVITGISLDHAAFLGDSIEKIAAEKAGIIKRGVPVLWCGSDREADGVICNEARSKGAYLYRACRNKLVIKRLSLGGASFDFDKIKDIKISLVGDFQPQNAANALEALAILAERGVVKINEAQLREGMAKARWRGRFELLSQNPTVISDGGHNPEGIDAAVSSMKKYFGEDCRAIIVTGIMADKDISYISERLSEIAERVNCVTPKNPRALSAEEYSKLFASRKVQAEAYGSCREALIDAVRDAREKSIPVLCVGSLYMYKEIYTAAKEIFSPDTAVK